MKIQFLPRSKHTTFTLQRLTG